MNFNWKLAIAVVGATIVCAALLIGWVIFVTSITPSFSLEQFLLIFGVPMIIFFIMIGFSDNNDN